MRTPVQSKAVGSATPSKVHRTGSASHKPDVNKSCNHTSSEEVRFSVAHSSVLCRPPPRTVLLSCSADPTHHVHDQMATQKTPVSGLLEARVLQRREKGELTQAGQRDQPLPCQPQG